MSKVPDPFLYLTENKLSLGVLKFLERSDYLVRTDEDKKVSSLKTFFRTARVFVLLNSTARALNVFVKPGSRELISSLADDPQSLSAGMKIGMAAFHFLITSFISFTLLAYSGISSWYAEATEPIIRQTR